MHACVYSVLEGNIRLVTWPHKLFYPWPHLCYCRSRCRISFCQITSWLGSGMFCTGPAASSQPQTSPQEAVLKCYHTIYLVYTFIRGSSMDTSHCSSYTLVNVFLDAALWPTVGICLTVGSRNCVDHQISPSSASMLCSHSRESVRLWVLLVLWRNAWSCSVENKHHWAEPMCRGS